MNFIIALMMLLIISPVIAYIADYSDLILILFDYIWVILALSFLVFFCVFYRMDLKFNRGVKLSIFSKIVNFFETTFKSVFLTLLIFISYSSLSNYINDDKFTVIKENILFKITKNNNQRYGHHYFYKSARFQFRLNSDKLIYNGTLIKKESFFGLYQSIYLCNTRPDFCHDLGLKNIEDLFY